MMQQQGPPQGKLVKNDNTIKRDGTKIVWKATQVREFSFGEAAQTVDLINNDVKMLEQQLAKIPEDIKNAKKELKKWSFMNPVWEQLIDNELKKLVESDEFKKQEMNHRSWLVSQNVWFEGRSQKVPGVLLFKKTEKVLEGLGLLKEPKV